MADLAVKEFNMHAATEVQPTHILAETGSSEHGRLLLTTLFLTISCRILHTHSNRRQG